MEKQVIACFYKGEGLGGWIVRQVSGRYGHCNYCIIDESGIRTYCEWIITGFQTREWTNEDITAYEIPCPWVDYTQCILWTNQQAGKKYDILAIIGYALGKLLPKGWKLEDNNPNKYDCSRGTLVGVQLIKDEDAKSYPPSPTNTAQLIQTYYNLWKVK